MDRATNALPQPPAALRSSPLRQPEGDEAELRAAALEGDLAAWDALIRRHDRRVMVALLARGLRVDRARDVAQETWVKLIEQQRAGKLAQLTLPGLALAQASFLAADHLRREAVAHRLAPYPLDAGGNGAKNVPDPAADVEARMLGTERLARAQAVLAECSPSAREVFKLCYGDPPHSYGEAADRVGLSQQRVRQIVCEVRKLLRAAFQEGER